MADQPPAKCIKMQSTDEHLANPLSKTFIPKQRMSHTHGRITFSSCPPITAEMGDAERCLAFNINKNAVNGMSGLTHANRLTIMGNLTNTISLVEVKTNEFKTTGKSSLKQPANLTALSCHNAAGNLIQNCLDDEGQLKPIQDGPVANCRPDGIMCAKIRGIIDLASLSESARNPTITFFIRLPVENANVTNAAGNQVNPFTFNGPSNCITLDNQACQDVIHDNNDDAIQEPFDLQAPDFTNPDEATVSTEAKGMRIDALITQAGYKTILNDVFTSIAPTFVDDPFKMLSRVHQTTDIRLSSTELIDTSQQTAPAATAQAFLNGSTTTRLPNRETWIQECSRDQETNLMIRMINNPALINKEQLQNIHCCCRQPMRAGNIRVEDKMLVIRESVDSIGNFAKPRIVPSSLRNIIFIAFHTNPIGSHFSVCCTFHRIRLHFFWPTMYKHVADLISKCPGCTLANARHRQKSELVCSFPVDEPFKLTHADAHMVGHHQGFQGEKCCMNVVDGMSTFAVSEEIYGEVNAESFSKAIMKILLNHGLCHAIVIDKDSKFRGVFIQAINLLGLNLHQASGGNHDPILTERHHAFLNKSLRIFCNERDSVRTATEGIQLSAHAWNSAPVVGADVSRSLVAIGRECRFPIDCTDSSHIDLRPTTTSVENYAEHLRRLLPKCQEVFRVLIQEHRAMHRECVNGNRPEPLVCSVGDFVFIRRAVKSDAQRGRVDKIMCRHTGPWKITEKLPGASCRIRHCKTNAEDKKHASHITPCPTELIPFPPLTGPDNACGQINRQIKKHPFSEAGIDSYTPLQPWSIQCDNETQTSQSLLSTANMACVESAVHFPTLAELNDELDGVHTEDGFLPATTDHLKPSSNEVFIEVLEGSMSSTNNSADSTGPQSNIGAPTVQQNHKQSHSVPNLNQLMARIIQSNHKSFFMSHRAPGTTHTEWNLVQVNLERTMAENPNAFSDGKICVDFYARHPHDAQFNAPNQRHWKEHHELNGRHVLHNNFHLLKPSPNETSYARDKRLIVFSQWVHIHHPDVFLHGPFNFAMINGRQTRDRMSAHDWKMLSSLSEHYDNESPSPNLSHLSHSCHVSAQFHAVHQDPAIEARLSALLTCEHTHDN